MTEVKRRGISGSTLKWIAMVTMLCDHFSVLFLMPYWHVHGSMFDFDAILATPEERMGVTLLCFGLRFIGRLAMPIFCFLLTEGLFYTRNRWRYLSRIVIFALISELPLDYAIFGRVNMGYQNTLWTLAIGLAVCMALDEINKLQNKWCEFAMLGVILAGCGLAELLHTDYGASCVVLIAVLWLARSSRIWQCVWGAVLVAYEYTAPLAFVPIYFYNGQRGRQMKYFFYIFYPAHITLILCLQKLFGI